jgi:hypothetical protein
LYDTLNRPFQLDALTQAGWSTRGTLVFGGYLKLNMHFFLKKVKAIGQNHAVSTQESVNLINLDYSSHLFELCLACFGWVWNKEEEFGLEET